MPITIDSIKSGEPPKPPRIAVYSVPGAGKTTLGASAPSPIFLQTEDGLGTINAPTFGLLKTYGEIMEAIGVLMYEPHDFRTVVFDTLDHAEPIVLDHANKQNGWSDADGAKYGRSHAAAVDHWRVLLDGMDALRDERGMSILLLAHSAVVNFDNPEHGSYSRYQPKLHKLVSPLIVERSDALLFLNYRISTVKAETGFKKITTRAVGGGERVLFTDERPSYMAKNRYNMPSSISLAWDAIAEHVPYFNQAA